MKLDSKIPEGPLAEKWTKHKFNLKLVNPANKRKYDVIVVGTGLAGASAAASLGELGYNVKAFCFQDSARRAHSIAAAPITLRMFMDADYTRVPAPYNRRATTDATSRSSKTPSR